MENSTQSDTAHILCTEDIKRAIEVIKKYSEQPFIVYIECAYEFWESVEKSPDIRNFALYGGIQVIKNIEIPEGIARFRMSDGTHKDIEMKSKPTFLST